MTPSQPMLLNCPSCGAPLDYDGTSSVIRCKFCGNRSLVEGASREHTGPSDSNLDEIRQLAASGDLQSALEQMRAHYGVDIEDAQDALNALQEGRFATRFVSTQHTPDELTQTLGKIQSLLAENHKIEAIKVYREVFDTSLTRAKQAIDMLENGQGLQVETHYDSFQTQTPPLPPIGTTPKKKGCGSVALVVTLVLVIAVAAAILFAVKGGLFIPHYYAQEPEILIPGAQGASPQFAGLFYDSSADSRFIGLVNPESKRMVWQGTPLNGDVILQGLVNGSDLIYAANGDNLIAYHKSDGTQAWQTVMPDALNYGGTNLVVTSGRVITHNADQSIQAYNAETGSLVWSKRLSGYSDKMMELKGSLLVVDFTDSNNNYGLFLLDPINGDQQALLTPTCTINDYPNALDTDTGLFYDAAENALYLIFYEGCVEKLDLATQETAWTTINPEYFHSFSNDYSILDAEGHFYFGDDGNLYDVTKANGTLTLLSQNEDYKHYPLLISGDLLLVRADRTRGTSRTELWGMDLASGTPKWQITMQDAEPIDEPNKMSGFIDDTDFGWTIHQTPAGLMRLTFKGEPSLLVLDTLNLTDGSVASSQTISIKGTTGDFYDIPIVLGWQDNVAYLMIDSSFYTLDVSAGTLVQVY